MIKKFKFPVEIEYLDVIVEIKASVFKNRAGPSAILGNPDIAIGEIVLSRWSIISVEVEGVKYYNDNDSPFSFDYLDELIKESCYNGILGDMINDLTFSGGIMKTEKDQSVKNLKNRKRRFNKKAEKESNKFSRISLSKDEIKLYRKLLEKKLNEINLVDRVIFVNTDKKKSQLTFNQVTKKIEQVQIPVTRGSNPHRNLIKKLLRLSVGEVQRFLDTDFSEKEEHNEVQIQKPE